MDKRTNKDIDPNIIKDFREQAEQLYQDYQSGKIPLSELAAFFKIYNIDNIAGNYGPVLNPVKEGGDSPLLRLIDVEKRVIYWSTFEYGNSRLGNHPDLRLNKPILIVTEIPENLSYKIERAYFTDSDTPIYEQLTINDDITQYGAIPQIVFRRDYTRGVDNSITSKTLSIKYRLLEPRTEKHENEIMFRIYKEKVLLCASYGQLLESHGNEHQNNWHLSTIKKGKLSDDSNESTQLFGGVDSLTFRTWGKNVPETNISHFEGVCIEKTKDIQEGCYPATAKISKHFKTIEPDTISAISFKGESYDAEKWEIIIIKKPYGIQIKIPKCPKTIIISNASIDPIQKEEINKIIAILESKAGSLEATQCVIPQLQLFAEKLETRDYNLVDALNPLDPQRLWNQPLENIFELCAYHRNAYFKIMEERLQPDYKSSLHKKPGETGNNNQ